MHDRERRVRSPAELAMRLVVLSLVAVLLMALQLTGRLGTLEGAVAWVTTPGQMGLASMTDRVSGTLGALANFRRLPQRVNELERINESLLVENLRLNEVGRENQRLRELLAFAETRPSVEFRGGQIIARVIGHDSNNFLNFVMLDLGYQHGIEVGMPVVNDQGLVGRIDEVTDTTSQVLLITDPASTVNGILQSSRLTGLVNGRPGFDPVMGFIRQGSAVSVGEVVLTSGMGGNFPKGIPIGQIVAVRQRDFEPLQEAVVRPTVNFGRLEFVLVVTNFEPLDFVPELEEFAADAAVSGPATPDAGTTPPPAP